MYQSYVNSATLSCFEIPHFKASFLSHLILTPISWLMSSFDNFIVVSATPRLVSCKLYYNKLGTKSTKRPLISWHTFASTVRNIASRQINSNSHFKIMWNSITVLLLISYISAANPFFILLTKLPDFRLNNSFKISVPNTLEIPCKYAGSIYT